MNQYIEDILADYRSELEINFEGTERDEKKRLTINPLEDGLSFHFSSRQKKGVSVLLETRFQGNDLVYSAKLFLTTAYEGDIADLVAEKQREMVSVARREFNSDQYSLYLRLFTNSQAEATRFVEGQVLITLRYKDFLASLQRYEAEHAAQDKSDEISRRTAVGKMMIRAGLNVAGKTFLELEEDNANPFYIKEPKAR